MHLALVALVSLENAKVLGFIDLPRLHLPKWGRSAHRCVLEEVNRRKRCPNNICKYIGICADQQCSSTEIFILYMIFTKYLPTKLCSWWDLKSDYTIHLVTILHKPFCVGGVGGKTSKEPFFILCALISNGLEVFEIACQKWGLKQRLYFLRVTSFLLFFC